MENFEKREETGEMRFKVDGVDVVLKQEEANNGLSFRIVEGLQLESDDSDIDLVVDHEGATHLDTHSDYFQCGWGSQKIEKDGVFIDLQEGRVTGPDIEKVKEVLKSSDFQYVDSADI